MNTEKLQIICLKWERMRKKYKKVEVIVVKTIVKEEKIEGKKKRLRERRKVNKKKRRIACTKLDRIINKKGKIND